MQLRRWIQRGRDFRAARGVIMRLILGMLSGLAASMGLLVILIIKVVAKNGDTTIFGSHVFGIIAVGTAIVIIGLALNRMRSKLSELGFSYGVTLGVLLALTSFVLFLVKEMIVA